MALIFRTNRFNRCLEALRLGGGDAAIAAKRAERLVTEMSMECPSGIERRWQTHNGEARIDGCRKFYIGRRFRLICIKGERQVVFAFAGPHDECDRWIEKNRNRDFSPLLAAGAAADWTASLPEAPAASEAAMPALGASEPGPETDYEAYLRQRISERDLSAFLGELFSPGKLNRPA
ncbi:MAG TPA: hypothetical protein DCZ75_10105 [Geobacter sp.]|nr:hypothetical protein [Geobacter sp.]